MTYPLYLYLAEENAKTVAGHTETDVVRHIREAWHSKRMEWDECGVEELWTTEKQEHGGGEAHDTTATQTSGLSDCVHQMGVWSR